MSLSAKSGKALTFILIVFVVLMFSVAAIAVFFFMKELDAHQLAQSKVDQLQAVEAKLNADLKAAQDQIALLDGKRKDAEATIESLQQEVDLQKNAKEEVQKQNSTLQENLQKEVQAKEEVRSRLTQDLQAAQDRYNAIKAELDKALAHNKELQSAKTQLQSQMQPVAPVDVPPASTSEPAALQPGIELGKIVVNPSPNGRGKVISVDSDTDFVIVSLGEKDGVAKGDLLSVFRGDEYLGDIKVSRVLAQMSAADFVPPFKSQSVKKDDQVVPKK